MIAMEIVQHLSALVRDGAPLADGATVAWLAAAAPACPRAQVRSLIAAAPARPPASAGQNR